MIFVPVIVVILFAVAFAPVTPRRRRRKPKGFFQGLLDGQRQTERKNNSHRGVMCRPSGSKKKRYY